MQGERIFIEERELTRAQLEANEKEYASMIAFIQDWENGRFTITLTEYDRLSPAFDTAVTYFRTFQKELSQKKS